MIVRGFFEQLDLKLTTTTIITYPNWVLPFDLMCDESDVAVGPILGQHIIKVFHTVYYASKTMNSAQVDYTITEKEILVIVFTIEKFHPYLMGAKVIFHTDLAELCYLMSKKKSEDRLMGWILLLKEFDIDIQDNNGNLKCAAVNLLDIEMMAEATMVRLRGRGESSKGRFPNIVKERSLTHEREFLIKDLDIYNPAVLEQFTNRKGWIQFTEKLLDIKEHLVRKFYTNTKHIVKGTKVTKVSNLKIKFDQHTLNTYLELEDVDPKEYLAKLAEKEESDEPVVVAPGPSEIPSTSTEPSTSAIVVVPKPPSSPPSLLTPALRLVSSPTVPLSALRVSQTLAALAEDDYTILLVELPQTNAAIDTMITEDT
uniref:Reverse transcriptase RNase H-like domain-containing protein n=1 Tax=Nicotiana tabacum TaxID=4097 RepID=A0A1S3YPF9_TOBAC|nr:PREDICTED: uncharacterized protein LOC107778209 [Nicotiana tabacum]